MRNDLDLDLSLLSNELKLLLLFMGSESKPLDYSIHEGLLTGINWDLFLQLTRHHRVYPYICHKLKEIEHKIPPYVVQEVSREYKKNTFQMLHLSGELECLCKCLSENKIQVLLLKGPVLAVDLYGDLSLRTSGDLDMLIPINDLDKVHELLISLNYEKEDYFSTVLDEWKWRHHHFAYFHREKRVKLEIHWRLHPGPSWEPDFQDLWNRKRLSTLTSHPVYILGREDLFVFLAAHGARHGWSRLRWLMDIDRIAGQSLDWSQLYFLLKKYRLLQVGGQALILSSQLLATPYVMEMSWMTTGSRPKRLAQAALFYIKQMVNLHTVPVPAEVFEYHKRHLFSLMSIQQKGLFLLSQLYPYPKDAETMPLPKSFHFLYFPLRPLLCAWRKIRKLA
jgi:hypothetical protein